MQQKMLRISMATNLRCRRVLQEGAAASGGAPLQFSGGVHAAAPVNPAHPAVRAPSTHAATCARNDIRTTFPAGAGM